MIPNLRMLHEVVTGLLRSSVSGSSSGPAVPSNAHVDQKHAIAELKARISQLKTMLEKQNSAVFEKLLERHTLRRAMSLLSSPNTENEDCAAPSTIYCKDPIFFHVYPKFLRKIFWFRSKKADFFVLVQIETCWMQSKNLAPPCTAPRKPR